jgi:isopropylmalate/homocitrate/citramalate synthase
MDITFTSLNPYKSLEVFTTRSADDLVKLLRAIPTEIKIINIVANNGRYSAFVVGDIRKKIKRNSNKGEIENV